MDAQTTTTHATANGLLGSHLNTPEEYFLSLLPSPIDIKSLLISQDDIFKEHRVVDSGTFGDVTNARYSHPDRGDLNVAIKYLRIYEDEDIIALFRKEVCDWSMLSHPNVLPLIGFFFDNKFGYPSFVSEWMENGSALDYVKRNPDHDLKQLIIGAAKGLEYLHENGIIHSDIKPNNIVVNSNGDAFICDFGGTRIIAASKSLALPSKRLKGTPNYFAPELLAPSEKSKGYTKKTDVWAFGMTIYALLTQEHPYYSQKTSYYVTGPKFNHTHPPYPSSDLKWSRQRREVKDKLWAICKLCWEVDPDSRADIPKILSLLTT